MNLIKPPEMNMTLDQLSTKLEEKAERKMALYQELMQLDADVIVIVGIMTANAIKELGGA